jgi:hypothetical protein
VCASAMCSDAVHSALEAVLFICELVLAILELTLCAQSSIQLRCKRHVSV